MRGEYRLCPFAFQYKLGSPPLARGVLSNTWWNILGTRITPACAGSTSYLLHLLRLRWDHPRLRGEYNRFYGAATGSVVSPPLARGVLSELFKAHGDLRITPACAGSTFFDPFRYTSCRDHPRLRGEYLNGCECYFHC